MADRKERRSGLGALAMAVTVVALALCAVAPAASATPVLKVKTRWAPTVLEAGGTGQIMFVVRNGGDSDSGSATLTDQLPPGVAATGFSQGASCAGTTTITCTVDAQARTVSSGDNGYGGGAFGAIIAEVTVAPDASVGAYSNTATVTGGGSASDSDIDQIEIGGAPAGFGLVPGGFAADVFDAQWPAGVPERQAGAHPFEMRVDYDLNLKHEVNSAGSFNVPEGNARTFKTKLPVGLLGNPEATPKCTGVDFLSLASFNAPSCPAATQVGTIDLQINDGSNWLPPDFFSRVPIYNLEPPRGAPADFGFSLAAGLVRVHILPILDPAQDYAIQATSPEISTLGFVRDVQATFWGVPADPAHDLLRTETRDASGDYGAKVDPRSRPFLTLPSDCGVSSSFAQQVDSWQAPEQFATTDPSPAGGVSVSGCDDPRVRFGPDIAMQPSSRAAGGPTGLDVHLEVDQKEDTVNDPTELYDSSGSDRAIATPPMKKVVVTFPEGMTLSTSAAQGLGNCSAAEIGLGTNSPVRCPENSRYGVLTLHTPILPKDAPMVGDIYIAKQHENPFGNFLSMYFVIHDNERGLLVKLAGKIELDPKTGQITTTFDDLPQFPIDDMQMNFKSGVRAALVNPSTCGTKTIRAEFFSWADPTTPHVVDNDYEVTQKADGSPCVKSLAERPFKPELEAGTVSSSAGTYSPFTFRLTRTDDDQEFSQLSTILPPGLLANISGLSECPEAGIAQAEAKSRTGGAEALFPSCPASSQIGTTDVGSGVGQVITYIGGKAYLAGPYKGAPLSMVVITPILAGPYDLGVIAVRSAIHVDAQTAQVAVATEPFPQIFEGIPVRIRDIRVKVDRPNTTINPTNCDPMAVSAHVTGTGGNLESTADDTAVDLTDRFQAANCGSLPFKPKLSFKLKGGTKRGQFPALQATLKGRPGDANIARSVVTLPISEFIEQGHIRTVCTRVQFAVDQCPPGSIYGTASAKSPLFDETLSGPVYLRSNGGERLLPDLVVTLNGKIDVTLAGFIDSTKGRVRNTFDVIPDAPVTRFTLSMQGGKRGLLVNHLDLCEVTARADVRFTGQNGKSFHSRPAMGTSCGKAKKKPDKAMHHKTGRGASR